jgi:hypothetical protein
MVLVIGLRGEGLLRRNVATAARKKKDVGALLSMV